MSGIYWIEGPWRGRLAIIDRPRGGDWLPSEVSSWQRNQLDVIVSLLTQHEVTELRLDQEATTAAAEGIMFLTFPIPDRGLPASVWAAHKFVEQLEALLIDGHYVAIHCRHGIGRSALMAASLLVRSGLDCATAFARVERTRGCPVPDTAEQRQWVEKFAVLIPVPLFG